MSFMGLLRKIHGSSYFGTYLMTMLCNDFFKIYFSLPYCFLSENEGLTNVASYSI